MYLTEYQKVTIDNFMGLWARDSLDDIPIDHASDAHNVSFSRKREVKTRDAASISRTPPSPVVRQFIAAFDQQTLIPIHCDGNSNIWRDDNNTIILTLLGMIDADFLNMNNHLYIAPMMSQFDNNHPPTIYVWTSANAANGQQARPAAGPPPTIAPGSVSGTPLVLSTAVGGNTGPGWYGVAFSWVYDTGYVSAPGPVPYATIYLPSPGMHIDITSGAPYPTPAPGQTIEQALAAAGITGWIVWVTQGQQDIVIAGSPVVGSGKGLAENAQLFQVATLTTPGNYTPPNNIELNFFDTDLVISADALPGNGDVINNIPFLPSGVGIGSIALQKYHGRMLIIGATFLRGIDDDPASPTYGLQVNIPIRDDRVWVSNPGAPENFNELTGYISVPTEFDGNICRAAFELFGVLYITKAIGIFATQDNGSDPNDPTNPWIVNVIDGGIGAYNHSIGTISGSQSSLSFNSTAFLANQNGLFLFNGNVLRPELTWKIRAVWNRIAHGGALQPLMRVTVDIFNDRFYVLLPVPPDDPAYPFIFLLGDYSLGLDSQNIRWATWDFPPEWGPIHDIIMGYYPGDIGGNDDYWLRLGYNGAIFRLDGITRADNGIPIDNWYQSAPLVPGDIGSLNIFRFIRYRMSGSGTLTTTLYDQGDSSLGTQTAAVVIPETFPGNYKDHGIQINFTNEKMSLRFEMNGETDYFTMARFDVFGKTRWPTRPNA